jgi:hypothetical protein
VQAVDLPGRGVTADQAVHLSALVPLDGVGGLPTLQEAGPASALLADGAIVLAADGKTATVAPVHARAAFYGRCSTADAGAALARLCPEPLVPMMTPLTLGAGFAPVCKEYIGASHDRAVPPDFQQTMAGRCGATHHVIEADHSPFYSASDELVGMLLERL